MRGEFWCFIALALGGCAAGAAPATPAAAPADTPAASEPGAAPPTANGERAGADPNAVLEAPGPEAAAGPVNPNIAVDLGQWCAEREIVASLDVERCLPALIGRRPDDTLWCFRREELDDVRVLYYQALYTVQGKKLVKLVELPYAASPRPSAGKDEPGYYVKLGVAIAADQKGFTAADDTSPNCQEALARVRAELSYNPPALRPLEELIGKVCATRGKYTAAGQRAR